MRKNRFLSILVASAFAALCAGSALAADPQYVMKVGYIVPETQSDHIIMRDVFKKDVEAKSGGRIKVELYPNAQLGGDRELTESVQLGTIQMAIPATSALAGFDKRFQVFDLPFLFKSKQAAYKALDGELGRKLDALLPAMGMVNLGYGENGFRHITNNRGPIHKPEDLKGLKIRTMENTHAHRLLQAPGRQPHADELRRALHGPPAEDRGRGGEPHRPGLHLQVLRGPEVLLPHGARLQRHHAGHQQEVPR
jgi:TRAP-type C4-dicarboxylate transport system substrate-binding protein